MKKFSHLPGFLSGVSQLFLFFWIFLTVGFTLRSVVVLLDLFVKLSYSSSNIIPPSFFLSLISTLLGSNLETISPPDVVLEVVLLVELYAVVVLLFDAVGLVLLGPLREVVV